MFDFPDDTWRPPPPSRYEIKYLVAPYRLAAVRAFIRPFTVVDRIGLPPGVNAFSVCSLYLDSEDLVTYRQAATGEMQRFKLRLRTYSDDADAPVFLEVKRKSNRVVSKLRARLSRAAAKAWLNGCQVGHVAHDDRAYEAAEIFRDLQARVGARPVMRVRYRREAYESQPDARVRITFDTELAYAVTLDDELGHVAGRWAAPSVDGVVLEVKFTGGLPDWVQELVRAFALHQQAVPKYGMCVEHLIASRERVALTMAGFATPAGRL